VNIFLLSLAEAYLPCPRFEFSAFCDSALPIILHRAIVFALFRVQGWFTKSILGASATLFNVQVSLNWLPFGSYSFIPQ